MATFLKNKIVLLVCLISFMMPLSAANNDKHAVNLDNVGKCFLAAEYFFIVAAVPCFMSKHKEYRSLGVSAMIFAIGAGGAFLSKIMDNEKLNRKEKLLLSGAVLLPLFLFCMLDAYKRRS